MIQKLHTMRQGAHETVQQYVVRFQEVAQWAYEGIPEAQQESLMLAQFQNGLQPHIRRHIVVAGPTTFLECYKLAAKIGDSPYLFPVEFKESPYFRGSPHYSRYRGQIAAPKFHAGYQSRGNMSHGYSQSSNFNNAKRH